MLYAYYIKHQILSGLRVGHDFTVDHFTVLCSATWPLNGSEAGGDLVLIKTSLSLLCRSSYSYAN